MGVETERLQQQYMLLTAGPSLWPLCGISVLEQKQTINKISKYIIKCSGRGLETGDQGASLGKSMS